MNKYFSIIIPVFNVEEYIHNVVQSVLKQNYTDYEIILIDDGSTDQSGTICDEYAKKHSQIYVIHQTNGGLSSARNSGLTIAQGEYIVFVDGDDMLAEGALRKLVEVIHEYNSPECIINRRQAFITNSRTEEECAYYFDKRKLSSLSRLHLYKHLIRYKDMWFGAWIFVLRREIIEKNRLLFVEGIVHEDDEWSVRVFLSCQSFGFNNSVLYSNRLEREGSIISERNIQNVFDLLKVSDMLYSLRSKTKGRDELGILVSIAAIEVIRSIMCLWQYRSNKRYTELVNQINNQIYLLRIHKRIDYLMVYYSCKTLGFIRTSKLLNCLRKAIHKKWI